MRALVLLRCWSDSDVFHRVVVPRIKTSLPQELIQAHIQIRKVQEINNLICLFFPASPDLSSLSLIALCQADSSPTSTSDQWGQMPHPLEDSLTVTVEVQAENEQ